MRLSICFVIVAFAQSVWGRCPAPTVQEIQEWEQRLDQGKNSLAYEIADRLYHLPEEPWSEDHKRLLLRVLNRHQEIRAALRSNRLVIWEGTVPKDRGHYAGNMVQMASWQKDPRFIPFIADHIGGGVLPERSLADLGKSAFSAVMDNLNARYDGWSNQDGAVGVCEIWLANRIPFLQNGEKRERLKTELFRMSRVAVENTRMRAIDGLRYFNEPEVIARLEDMSRNDLFTLDGKFPVRARAQEALKFMRARGSGL